MDQLRHIEAMGLDFVSFWEFWNGLPKQDLIPHLRDYLDQVPPHLQPNVVIMDVYSDKDMQVRLTGTAVVEFAGEMTGSHAESLYSGETRRVALAMVWKAVNHPCGYGVTRVLRNNLGRLVDSGSLVLPLETESSDCKTVVGYNELPEKITGIASKKQIEAVQEVKSRQWIDIGAGIPS